MSTIRSFHYDPSRNLMGLPNVFSQPPNLNHPCDQTNVYMYETLHNLVRSRPNWTFKVTDYEPNEKAFVATSFELLEDGHHLGGVKLRFKGRGYHISVFNHRISAKRERVGDYTTTDPKKAELCIRKNLYRMDSSELVDNAQVMAREIVHRDLMTKVSVKERRANELFSDAPKFALANIDQYLLAYPKRASSLKVYKDAMNEASVLDAIKSKFDAGNAYVVVLDGAQYALGFGTKTKTVQEHELPHSMRGKIGMLKLVADRQAISDVGYRMDKLNFIVVCDEGEFTELGGESE